MPPNIENALYSRGVPAWHGLGTVIDGLADRATIEEKVPELAAVVVSEPLESSGRPGFYENVRTDRDGKGRRLALKRRRVGVVQGPYRLYQPADLMDVAESLSLADSRLRYESAISLRGGSVVCLLARLDEARAILGDRIDPYLLLVNSYDGSYSPMMALTPLRVECQNLLTYAIRSARRIVRLAHGDDLKEHVAHVQEALGLTERYLAELDRTASGLHALKLPRATGRKSFLARLAPDPEPWVVDFATSRSLPSSTRETVWTMREQIGRIIDEAPDLANHRDTGWGALQAVTAWWDHALRSQTPEQRMELLALSTHPESLPQRALAVLTEMAADERTPRPGAWRPRVARPLRGDLLDPLSETKESAPSVEPALKR